MGSGCFSIMKALLILLNAVFFLISLPLIGIALWQIISSYAAAPMEFMSGLYLLLACGVVLVVIATAGIIGATKNSQCCLVTFFCLLLLVLVGQVVGVYYAISNQPSLMNMIKEKMDNTISSDYYSSHSTAATFDGIQAGLQCCGAKGPGDWKMGKTGGELKFLDVSIPAGVIKYDVPESCCKNGINENSCEINRKGITVLSFSFPDEINTKGCLEALQELCKTLRPYMMGVCIGIASIEVLALIFSICLCFASNNSHGYKA